MSVHRSTAALGSGIQAHLLQQWLQSLGAGTFGARAWRVGMHAATTASGVETWELLLWWWLQCPCCGHLWRSYEIKVWSTSVCVRVNMFLEPGSGM